MNSGSVCVTRLSVSDILLAEVIDSLSINARSGEFENTCSSGQIVASHISVLGRSFFDDSVSILKDLSLGSTMRSLAGDEIRISAGFSIAGNLKVEQWASISGSSAISGNVRTGSISVHGVTILGSVLSVSDMARLESDLQVNNEAVIRDLSVLGKTHLNSNLSAGGPFYCFDEFYVGESIVVGDSLSVNSNVQVGRILSVDSNLAVGGSFSVGVCATIASGCMSVTGSALLGTILSVHDGAFVNGDLRIESTLLTREGVSIQGNLQFGSVFTIGAGGSVFISGDANTGTGYLHGVWISETPVTTSDLRFKKNIVPLVKELSQRTSEIKNATEIVNALRPVAFSMDSLVAERRYGFIAQELEKLVPDLVISTNDTDTKGILYQDIIALLVGAFQERMIEEEATSEQLRLVQNELQRARAQNRQLEELAKYQRQMLYSMNQRLLLLESRFENGTLHANVNV
jgi:hypothetical protein